MPVLLARCCAAALFFLSVVALAGWLTGRGQLASPLPGLPPIQPGAALAFLASALAIVLYSTHRLAGAAFASVAPIALGAVALADQVLDIDPSLDWTVQLFRATAGHQPGRIGLATAAALIVAGLGLLTCARSTRLGRAASGLSGGIIAGVGLASLLSSFAQGANAYAGVWT